MIFRVLQRFDMGPQFVQCLQYFLVTACSFLNVFHERMRLILLFMNFRLCRVNHYRAEMSIPDEVISVQTSGFWICRSTTD